MLRLITVAIQHLVRGEMHEDEPRVELHVEERADAVVEREVDLVADEAVYVCGRKEGRVRI